MSRIGKYEFPVISPYRGAIPERLTPYNNHRTGKTYGAIHFFIDDYRFSCMHIWDNLQRYTKNISKYNIIIAPDNSLYLDQSKALNIYQVYQNRVITVYWQSLGFNVIPTVTWGNADSFAFCFDGLPTKSIIAIGGLGTKCSPVLTKLWKRGVELAIEKLKPIAIILYGAPIEIESSITTYYFDDYITQKFRNR